MEITTIPEASVKLRGKQATCVLNPVNLRAKVSANAALLFNRPAEIDLKRFEQEPLIIQGPGDYEVGGIKISGSKLNDSFQYRIILDGVEILAAKTSSLTKPKESVTEYDMLLLEADSAIEPSVITALNPSVIIFYGEKKAENVTALGKEASTVSKYSVTRDKLPAETQVIVLQ